MGEDAAPRDDGAVQFRGATSVPTAQASKTGDLDAERHMAQTLHEEGMTQFVNEHEEDEREPKSRSELKSAEDATQWLLSQKFISTVPWDDVGAYLRFSVTFAAKNEADEKRVLTEIGNRLSDVKFQF